MKSLKFLSVLLLLCVVTLGYSQKINTKLPGINTTVSVSAKDIVKTFNLDVKVPKTQEQQIGKAEQTASKAIYKSIEYPVYMTEKSKLFIVYPNKEGTGYSKKYIKQE
jgi:hypothetical protein